MISRPGTGEDWEWLTHGHNSFMQAFTQQVLMECPPQPELGDTAMNKELTLGRATSAQWDEGFAGETKGAQAWTKSQIWVEGMELPCSSRVILCCLSTSLNFPPATSSSLCCSPALTHTGEQATGVSPSLVFLILLRSLTSGARSPPPSQQRTSNSFTFKSKGLIRA